MRFELIATCPEEVMPILAQEIANIGCEDVRLGYKTVMFTADEEQFYRAHLWLRTASQIIFTIKECAAKDAVMLQSQARRVHWEEYFGNQKTFIVDANQTDRGPEFMTSNDLSKAVRLGIEDRFQHLGQSKPRVDLEDPDVKIHVYSHNQRCVFGINTSGKSLHKRGYKAADHPAPMKETLASAILLAAGYDGTQPLLDAMCGGGTIAIEAAMIALNKAPLIHRKRGEFAFERLRFFNTGLWRKAQDEARLSKAGQLPAPIYANDYDGKYVDMAREHALRARVEKFMTFSCMDFRALKKPGPEGIIVMNLPYGDRLNADEKTRLETLYTDVGRHLKHEFGGWKAALIFAADAPHKLIGLRPTKKQKFLNGAIPVHLHVYDLFAGRRDEFLAKRFVHEQGSAHA